MSKFNYVSRNYRTCLQLHDQSVSTRLRVRFSLECRVYFSPLKLISELEREFYIYSKEVVSAEMG